MKALRECFGPRFYKRQFAQSPEQSGRECHLHARNLLGEEGDQALLRKLEGGDDAPAGADEPPTPADTPPGYLFDVEDRPLFRRDRGA